MVGEVRLAGVGGRLCHRRLSLGNVGRRLPHLLNLANNDLHTLHFVGMSFLGAKFLGRSGNDFSGRRGPPPQGSDAARAVEVDAIDATRYAEGIASPAVHYVEDVVFDGPVSLAGCGLSGSASLTGVLFGVLSASISIVGRSSSSMIFCAAAIMARS